MPTSIPTARGAARILERSHREVDELVARLSLRHLRRSGIGAGEWSALDLVGHLESWERYALDALSAWAAGARAPIDVALDDRGLNAVNVEAVEENRRRSPKAVIRRAQETRGELLDALGSINAAAWTRPPTTRGRRPLGVRLGSILGGPGGPFRHTEAHLPDFRDFVDLLSRAGPD